LEQMVQVMVSPTMTITTKLFSVLPSSVE